MPDISYNIKKDFIDTYYTFLNNKLIDYMPDWNEIFFCKLGSPLQWPWKYQSKCVELSRRALFRSIKMCTPFLTKIIRSCVWKYRGESFCPKHFPYAIISISFMYKRAILQCLIIHLKWALALICFDTLYCKLSVSGSLILILRMRVDSFVDFFEEDWMRKFSLRFEFEFFPLGFLLRIHQMKYHILR